MNVSVKLKWGGGREGRSVKFGEKGNKRRGRI